MNLPDLAAALKDLQLEVSELRSEVSELRGLEPHSSPSDSSLLRRVGTRMHRMLDSASSNTPSMHRMLDSASSTPTSSPTQPPGPLTIRRNSSLSRLAPFDDEVVEIPESLRKGMPFLKVTHRKRVPRKLYLDEEAGELRWSSKSSAKLLVDNIVEIRGGADARTYREELRVSSDLESRWITIVHRHVHAGFRLRVLHLVVGSQSDFDELFICLLRLVKYRRELMSGLGMAGPRFIDTHWERSASNQSPNARLSFEQVVRFARQLHVHCEEEYLKRLFYQADLDRDDALSFVEFKTFVYLLKQRSDISSLYQEFNGDWGLLCRDIQGETDAEVGNIVSEDRFGELLLAQPTHQDPEEEQDLTRPLNEYFISSSHNTYLVGRQVVDSSSIETCVRALQDGCRCIELDCWDGSNEPLVYHGHGLTRLTGSLVFRDVIMAVLKYGFISSAYPLIISLEVRCGDACQLRIRKILEEVLGDHLVTAPIDDRKNNTLPSPSELKHRVLIKVKSTEDSAGLEDINVSDDSTGSSNNLSPQVSPKKTHIIPELAELGVYLSGRRFKTFNDSYRLNTCFSFSERTARRLNSEQLKRLTELYMVRVYPAAYRLNSSNFDPGPFWRLGLQMVALNWQRSDDGIALNRAYFSPKVGYVLKPYWLRPNGPDPPNAIIKRVSVTIISAQQLPRPRELRTSETFAPYVTVYALGLSDGGLIPQWRTNAIPKNGFNPRWDAKIEFTCSESDLNFACLKFVISSGDISFAFYTTRIATLLPGYRHLQLQDSRGEDYIFSTLFIRNEIT